MFSVFSSVSVAVVVIVIVNYAFASEILCCRCCCFLSLKLLMISEKQGPTSQQLQLSCSFHFPSVCCTIAMGGNCRRLEDYDDNGFRPLRQVLRFKLRETKVFTMFSATVFVLAYEND